MSIIALVPKTDNLPYFQDDPHVTIAYFGDDDVVLPDYIISELNDILEDLVHEVSWDKPIHVLKQDLLGEEQDAVVLLLDDSEFSTPVILRRLVLEHLSSEARSIFDTFETYPKYKPHLTLGYISEGYEYNPDAEVPSEIYPKNIGVWDGTTKTVYQKNPFDDELSPLESFLKHYGTPRHSGRFPWGSGSNPYQRGLSFIAAVKELEDSGLSDIEIADAMGMKTTELRARRKISKNDIRKEQEQQIIKLKEKQMSNVAIGNRLNMPEATVRARLKSYEDNKEDKLIGTMNILRDLIKDDVYIDVGEGVERYLGVSAETVKAAIVGLKDEGYRIHWQKVEQLGNPGNFTTVKVLTKEDVTRSDVKNNLDRIKSPAVYSDDGGKSYEYIKPPVVVSSDRIGVRYGPDGGGNMDGIIQLRRGVEDLSLGDSRYGQVRISVDGTHFLKGMVMYADDLPNGVDILFNTDKKDTGNKLDAMKPYKPNEDNPFGSTVRQFEYIGKDGKKHQSPLNIVGDDDIDGIKHPGVEGAWAKWASKFSSQMLSKQSNKLAEQQLGLTYNTMKEEFDEINSLTNPTIKKQLLLKFGDSADSSAKDLKAVSLPRTANHVILPINSLKDNEIYAPGYRNGELVALVRHPHGGIFEIPVLKVNNKNPEANSVIPQAKDAVGINHKVASQLSGADFDGDTVLVIPTNGKTIASSPPLKALENFDPKIYYRDDIPKMKSSTKQDEMGKISNLITDMSLRDASEAEIARAVKHSMVVIDAEKHNLDYKSSALQNDIKSLKAKYQGGANAGASTLISRASSDQYVPHRLERRAEDGGAIDAKTGKKMYRESGQTTASPIFDKSTNEIIGWKEKPKKTKSYKMAETDDAFTLSSGTPMEAIYATHANKLKSLANEARKAALATPKLEYSKSAKKVYANEVASLNAKLNVALKNAPLERHAQVVGNISYNQKKDSNPDLSRDDLKKLKNQELAFARAKLGAKKQNIVITPKEWEAVQAGAISDNMMQNILKNTDIDKVKELAMPRDRPAMTQSNVARAKAMLNNGYTQADVAQALGVSVSTLYKAIE